MGYAEEYIKRKQEQTSSSKDGSSSKSKSYSEYYTEKIKSRNIESISENLTARLNSWLESSSNYAWNYQNKMSAQALDHTATYDSSSADWLSKLTEQKSALDAEREWLYNTVNSYKDFYDSEWVESVLKALDDGNSANDSVFKGAEEYNKYWSSFGSEDAYNEWSDYYSKYGYLTGSEDFAEKSKYKSTYRGGEKFSALANTYLDTGYDDIMYDYINRDQEAIERTSVKDIQSNAALLGLDNSERKEMTDDEIAIFNYLYATKGKDEAYDYIEYITENLNARQRASEELKWAEYAKESPIASSVFSIIASPLKSVSYVGQLSDYWDDGEIDQNAGYNKGSYINTAIRNEVGKTVEAKWGGVGSFAYQTGMSMGDFLFNTGITGGNSALSLGIMGTSAAADTVISARDRGLSSDQAFWLGAIAGAAEIVTEKLSLDALLDATSLGKSAVGYIVKNVLAEGSEEVGSSLINLTADILISKDKSEWQMAIDRYKASGMTDSEAFWRSVKDQALSLGLDFLGGAISGGVMGGVGAAINTVKNNSAAKKNYGDLAPNFVKETIEADPNNSFAQKMQAKLDNGKDLSGGQINRLMEVRESAFTTQDTAKIKAAVEQRLTNLGESGEISKLADIIVKAQTGKNLTKAERTVLTESKYGRRVSTELNPQSIESGEYASSWAENIGTKRINTEAYNKGLHDLAKDKFGVTDTENNSVANDTATTKKLAPEGKFKASDSGTTIITETSEEVTPTKIVSTDGGIKVELKGGKVVEASKLTFGTSNEAIAYEMVANMGVSVDTANALVNAFKTIEGDTTAAFVGMPLAYQYGKIGDEADLAKLDLTDSQKQFVYDLGRADVKTQGRTWSDTSRRTPEGNKSKAADDGIIYEGGELNEDSLTDIQKASIAGIRTIAKMSPSLETHVFESIIENGKKYAVVNGKKVLAPNGFFRNGNEIYIDINAGKGTKGAMLYTMSHEIVHFIAENSFEDFKALADFLFEHYGKNNVPVDQLIKREIDILKKSYKESGKELPNETVLYMKAYEEVVANAMSKMLADPKSYEKLAKLKGENLTLWERIGEAIKQMLDKLKSMLGIYDSLDPDQRAADYVNDFATEVYEHLQDLYLKGFVNAEAKYQASIGSRKLEDFADAKNTEGDTLLQYKAMEADEDTYRDMLKKWGKMTDTQVNNLFLTIDKAMELIKENLEALDYAWEADIDDRAFSPVKPNSDKLYQVSLDFSTLCRKRLLQQTIQAHLQEALNKPLTKEEGIAIRDALIALQEEGRQIEVACALCYVESARMKSPEQIKRFIDNREAVIKEFFAGKSGGSMKEKLQKAEDDARERLHKENPNGIKGKDGVTMLDPRTAKLNQLPKKYADEIRSAKRTAKQSYVPTADEQNLIEVAKSMTVSDFTSPEGLENLAKNYPSLFDAYTSYVRNATKSKGIENDTWWRAGDSMQIGDVLIANMNKENGLRSQSWSDFQVVHILDYIAATIELATRETKEQAYTKVPDYAELMGNTGVMINLSLIPTAKFNGSLDYDSVEGIDYKRALALRDKYHATVGTICIGIDNVQIKMLLGDITIDYVIPYHKSGMSAAIRKLMHIPTWSQYEEYQSEKNLSRSDAEKQAKKYGVKLLDANDPNYQKGTSFSEWFDIKEAQQIAKMENANPSDKAKQKKYGVMYGAYVAMQNAANNYLKLCAERGISPKFSHEKADFTTEENYWKLLIDRKMVDNVTGEVIEQQTIKPIFDENEVMRILNDELDRYPKVKADQEYAIRKVTEGMLSGEIKGGMSANDIAKAMQTPVDNVTNVNILASTEGDTLYSVDEESERDFSYNELVAKGNLQGVVIDKNQRLQMNGGVVDSSWLVNEVRKKCKVQNTKGEPVYYAEAPDIGRNVEIVGKGLTHGFDRPNDKRSGKSTPSAIINAKTSLNIVEILRNSIEVNRSQRGSNRDVPYTHVLMGVIEIEDSKGNKEYYAVRSMVQERINRNPLLVEVNILGTLTSTNAKKIGSPAVQVGKKTITLAGGRTHFEYSIADFLQDVKGVFDDTFSNDVYKHFGTQRATSDFSPYLLYSEQDTDSVSTRSLLANALESVAQNDIEKNKLAQYKKKIDLIESEYEKLSKLRAEIKELSFAKGKRDTARIKELQFQANQIANRINTYDRQLLNLESTEALKNVITREKEMARKKEAQKGKEALTAYKERAAKTQKELMNRYQESRLNAIEGRHKTEMKHKIKKVVAELNKLLLSPTKDQHVPIGLQGVVADALDVINMDTMNAEERVAYYNDLIAKSSDPDEIAKLTKKRDFFEYRDANFKDRISALKNAYAEFKESDDPLIRSAHDDAIENLIKNTADEVGNNSLKDMTLAQLESVYDMYKAVLSTVRNSNKMFKEGRQATVTDNSEAVKTEVKRVGGHHERVLKLSKFFKAFGWNMLKPVTAMKVIGSDTFAKLFDNVRAGEDTWAVDVNEAKSFYEETADKYGYKTWDFKKKYSFTDNADNSFSLTLEQIMSLYAYSKRDQADQHLAFGGFIFDDAIEVVEKNKLGIPMKYEVNDANPYRLRKEDLLTVIKSLDDKQKGFIDEMQTYLSDVMGAKGNEVSLALYDIKLYKEKNYFPLKTSKYFREFDPEKGGTPKIKNSGFSKKTVPKAGNPIVLSNFMDVWAGHVNDMSMYHAFVLPLEDFMRVYNYSSTAGGYDSVQQYIKNAYGSQANQYIERLVDDLNGGARVDSSAGVINKGLSLFKKASVFASASVVIQQPSAIARALAYINPKYFATSAPSAVNFVQHKKQWAEVKKYAPVAVIKEMGYFDTGMGKSTVEWIKGNQTIKDKADDVLSKAPAMADELSWVYIWEAVKKETADKSKLPVGSEAFLKKAGERFTEVITNTQVYDSVLSRSQMMRSKDTGLKMATAFMAEPLTTVNMMVDGILQGKRGNKKFTAATVGAVSASIILNSILVSIVYAARDDDEDETYTEKYIGSLTSELIDGFNPLTYIPFVKDIWSIAQGYDVERSDMSVISKLWESVEGMFNEKKSGLDKVLDVSGSVSSLFGIPLKNIVRDAKALYNVTHTLLSGTKTTKAGIAKSAGDAVRNSIPLLGRFSEEKSNTDLLYEAILDGDTTQIERVKKRFKDEDAVNSALRKGLRDNDERIKEAAKARASGDIAEYKRIAKEIIAEGNFSQDIVVGAINAEVTALEKNKHTVEEPPEEDKETSIYKSSDIGDAFESGDLELAKEIIEDLIKTKVANGMEEDKARSSVKSSITSYWKPLYKAAYKKGDTEEMKRIREILRDTELYGRPSEIVNTCKAWLKDKDD